MKLLIASPVPERVVRQFLPTILLIRKLEERGVEFEFSTPFNYIDPKGYNVVLVWSHGRNRNIRRYVKFSKSVKAKCVTYNIPYIPSTELGSKHSSFFKVWHENSVPCPVYKIISSAGQIEFQYPMVLRSDEKMSSGKNLYLVRSEKEAEELIRQRHLDLSVGYVDTKYPDGLYRKWRCWVAGDKIFPRQMQVSTNWKISDDLQIPRKLNELNVEENRVFLNNGEDRSLLLAKAAKVAGLEICAIDYFKSPDGSITIFEGNRNFAWYGLGNGKYHKRYLQQTGFSKEEARQRMGAYVDAIIDLLIERAI